MTACCSLLYPACRELIFFSRASCRCAPTSQGYVYNDPACFANQILNHTLVIVGFNLLAPVPYWIARNSWGSAWGDGGYVNMAITGGAGTCGINVMPAIYPVITSECALPLPHKYSRF